MRSGLCSQRLFLLSGLVDSSILGIGVTPLQSLRRVHKVTKGPPADMPSSSFFLCHTGKAALSVYKNGAASQQEMSITDTWLLMTLSKAAAPGYVGASIFGTPKHWSSLQRQNICTVPPNPCPTLWPPRT